MKSVKHILIAMALKSRTGSRRVLTILNRLGYCINYTATEELETKLEYSILDRKLNCPDGAEVDELAGLAFDTYPFWSKHIARYHGYLLSNHSRLDKSTP